MNFSNIQLICAILLTIFVVTTGFPDISLADIGQIRI